MGFNFSGSGKDRNNHGGKKSNRGAHVHSGNGGSS